MKYFLACASCRIRRNKCDPDCWVAPYFPPHMDKKYINAQKVFGHSYITKLLKSLHQEPHKSCTAMKNLIAEADIRSGDPFGGCYGVVKRQRVVLNKLMLKIAEQEEELSCLRSQVSGGGHVNVAMGLAIQPSAMYREQGYIVQQNLDEQIDDPSRGDQEHGNFAQGFLHAVRQQEDQTDIDSQSQGKEVVVPEHDGGVSRPNSGEQKYSDTMGR